MLAVNAFRRVLFVVVAAALVALAPAFAASKKDENWVATWATALVIRPAPGTPGPAPAGPPAPNAAGVPPAAAAGGAPRPPPAATV